MTRAAHGQARRAGAVARRRRTRRTSARSGTGGRCDPLGGFRTAFWELIRKMPVFCGREAQKTPTASYALPQVIFGVGAVIGKLGVSKFNPVQLLSSAW